MRAHLVAILCVVLAPAAAAAQSRPQLITGVEVPKNDIAVGLGLFGYEDTGPDRSTIVISAARNYSDWFGVAGETGLYYRFGPIRPSGGRNWHYAGATLAAGPRFATGFLENFTRRGPIDFRLFTQLLGGVQVGDGGNAASVVQPGFGADFNTWSGLMFRFQWDWRFTGGHAPGGRLGASIVVPIGSRD